MSAHRSPTVERRRSDRGSVLPVVLVVVVVVGAVVAATAGYASSTLRYGQVTEARSDRLAAAQAATDDALEQLRLQRPVSVCGSLGGADTAVSYRFPEQINDTTVTVSCRLVNQSVPSNDNFALVITGEGMPPADATLDLIRGGQPEIRGPVFHHDPSRMSLKQPTVLFEGDLVYTDSPSTESLESSTEPCDVEVSDDIEFDRVILDPPIDNLEFDPVTRGVFCINRTWSELFGEPETDPDLDTLTAPAPYSDRVGPSGEQCRVFTPGRYTSAAQLPLTSSNYFESGVYHFDGLGEIRLSSKEVLTFGNANIVGYPALSNSDCDFHRITDSDDGAVLYVSGNTRFSLVSNPSGVDIAGRMIGQQRVAMHVLSTNLPAGATGLVESDSGNGREFALSGQLWAPDSSMLFETIPSKKTSMFRGGAVVAAIVGAVTAAGTDSFLIEVATASASGQVQLDAVASNASGTTSVRTILDYRTSNGDLAIRSRRVLW